MQDATSFEAQIINPNSSSSPIVSNSITTKITAPSLSPIKASVASNSVGEAISNTEFAFASQVTLTTNFVHQTISVPAGQTLTDVVTYA
ncbi:hypothetical protein J6W20_01585 [bacterium]|nr:hypothetical protein [bacterium]